MDGARPLQRTLSVLLPALEKKWVWDRGVGGASSEGSFRVSSHSPQLRRFCSVPPPTAWGGSPSLPWPDPASPPTTHTTHGHPGDPSLAWWLCLEPIPEVFFSAPALNWLGLLCPSPPGHAPCLVFPEHAALCSVYCLGDSGFFNVC